MPKGIERKAPDLPDRQRIDKWLWHARMVRSRSAAAALTQAGYVRVNGTRVTAASHPLRTGDVVTLALDRSVRLIRVAGFAERRADAATARNLYREVAGEPSRSPATR
jgi:ribosome-associated heat shock protein Hsp15